MRHIRQVCFDWCHIRSKSVLGQFHNYEKCNDTREGRDFILRSVRSNVFNTCDERDVSLLSYRFYYKSKTFHFDCTQIYAHAYTIRSLVFELCSRLLTRTLSHLLTTQYARTHLPPTVTLSAIIVLLDIIIYYANGIYSNDTTITYTQLQ